MQSKNIHLKDTEEERVQKRHIARSNAYISNVESQPSHYEPMFMQQGKPETRPTHALKEHTIGCKPHSPPPHQKKKEFLSCVSLLSPTPHPGYNWGC